MGLMTAELFNAIQNGAPVYPILELDIGGTTKRYGAAAVDVDSLGMYEERVLSWSPITRGASLTGASLQALNAVVEIEDMGRDLDQVVTGEFSRTVAGSAARGKLVSPAVSTASYFTFYSGVVKDYRKSGPLRYSFDLTTLDEPLNGRIKTPTLSKWDFPLAEDADRDIPVPLIFGEHDSTTVGGPTGGLIPCIRIGTIGGSLTYLIQHGMGRSLDQVFVGDDARTGNGTFYFVNGRRYSVVDTISGVAPTVSESVTVDVSGITDTGGSGGTLIKNPAEQLKQLLAWWIFDEMQDTTGSVKGIGATIPSTVPIDTGSFDAAGAFFDIHSIEGSRRLSGEETGMSILNEWCSNHSAVPYWNHRGKLAIAINDWFVDDIYDSAGGLLHTFSHNDDQGEFQYVFDTEILADEVSAEFMYSSADNKFFRTIRVIDTLRGIDRKEPRKLFWSRATLST